MTPKDAFDFKVLVIYLCNTHVKLEIHLSLPDNNAQNGASCMSLYLRPGVVLLMNMHEPQQGEERFAQPVSPRASDGSAQCSESKLPKPSTGSTLPSTAGAVSQNSGPPPC